ncbi:hypothetical protein BB561_000200 [Smittium simulii]|uniref:tRNA-splicing endonuclease subunit SEN34 n=1 Tax=Smittium simulii TaxID=133385 RepID=A0A2T9Z034_9FUNG|nr:hypothetical protein BB561_000200 [Smittium simulii]
MDSEQISPNLVIPVVLDKNYGLVHDNVRILREQYRIVGGLVGSLPMQPMQNSFLGLPLMLLPEELAVLLEIDAIVLVSPASALLSQAEQNMEKEPRLTLNWPISALEISKLAVFRDLWQKGYFLTPGLKFGGDYLVYPGDPMRYHSHFIATVTEYDSQLTCHEIVALGRVGTNVKKNRLLCFYNPNSRSIDYTTLAWAAF